MERIAPIFAVRDLDRALDFYRRLGFAVRRYRGGGYGFASRHGIELHLGVVPDDDRRSSAAYLFVDDADRVAAEWKRTGAEVHPSAGHRMGDARRRPRRPGRQRHPIRLANPLGRYAQATLPRSAR